MLLKISRVPAGFIALGQRMRQFASIHQLYYASDGGIGGFREGGDRHPSFLASIRVNLRQSPSQIDASSTGALWADISLTF